MVLRAPTAKSAEATSGLELEGKEAGQADGEAPSSEEEAQEKVAEN